MERNSPPIKGLPSSRDPYHSTRNQNIKQTNNQSSGLDNIGSLNSGLSEISESNAVTWEAFQLPNKHDLGFRRSDGFFLRARKFKCVYGKWIAQLYRNNKILDKGQVIVPDGYDAENFIKQIADYMLDGNSFRYQQDPSKSKPENTQEDKSEFISASGNYQPTEPENNSSNEELEEIQ